VLAVADEDAVRDLAFGVVGAHHLLAVAQARRVLAGGEVALTGLGVDEHRPAFGVGAAGA
jgi:hypothetical protein